MKAIEVAAQLFCFAALNLVVLGLSSSTSHGEFMLSPRP